MAQNSGKTAKRKRKAGGKPFAKGQSGNPGGRPKLPDDVKEWLALNTGAMTIEALDALRALFKDADGQVAARASLGWLNKTLPDTAIAIELTGKDGGPVRLDASKMTREEREFVRRLHARLAPVTSGA